MSECFFIAAHMEIDKMAAHFDEFGLGKDVLYQKRMEQLKQYIKFSKKWEKRTEKLNMKVIRLLEEDEEEMETGPASEISDGGNTALVVARGKEGVSAQQVDAQSEGASNVGDE